MIYQSEKMTYKTVMKTLCGKVNDVEVCEELQNETGAYYTLWIIKDHVTVKKIIRIMENSESKYDCCAELFTWQNQFCMAFAYARERPIETFYMARFTELENCGEICKNLVLMCMMSRLPYPFLYLVLKQKQLYLCADLSTEHGYGIDLSELEEQCDEAMCVRQCALIVRTLLQQKCGKRNVAYQLIVRKIPKQGYNRFEELYRDIKLSFSVLHKEKWIKRMQSFFYRNWRLLFRVLTVGCAILALTAVLQKVAETVRGEQVLFGILVNHFEMIGTESMIK